MKETLLGLLQSAFFEGQSFGVNKTRDPDYYMYTSSSEVLKEFLEKPSVVESINKILGSTVIRPILSKSIVRELYPEVNMVSAQVTSGIIRVEHYFQVKRDGIIVFPKDKNTHYKIQKLFKYGEVSQVRTHLEFALLFSPIDFVFESGDEIESYSRS